MSRRSCPMLASSLLKTKAESHKKKPSEWTMPTTDSIQIKFRDVRRPLMRSPCSSKRVVKIKTVAVAGGSARATLDGSANE
jgi:hypothetical protein